MLSLHDFRRGRYVNPSGGIYGILIPGNEAVEFAVSPVFPFAGEAWLNGARIQGREKDQERVG